MSVSIPGAQQPGDTDKVVDQHQRMTPILKQWIRRIHTTVKVVAEAAATSLTQLSDAPSSFTGDAGKYARVNPGETALEYDDLQAPPYTVAGVPSASPAGKIIYVSDESGGTVLAFSDGTNWRRVTDRAIIS